MDAELKFRATYAQEPNRGGQVDLVSRDPKVALQRMQLAPGYEVSLFASEPGAFADWRKSSPETIATSEPLPSIVRAPNRSRSM